MRIENKYKNESQSFYSTVPPRVRYHTDLSSDDKIAYMEIVAWSNEWGFCISTDEEIGKDVGLEASTIKGSVSKLHKAECVYVEKILSHRLIWIRSIGTLPEGKHEEIKRELLDEVF